MRGRMRSSQGDSIGIRRLMATGIPNTSIFRSRAVWTQQTGWNPPVYVWGFGVRDWNQALGKGLGPV